MVEQLIKRYLWLIDTLNRGGEMTFDEIAARWERAAANDSGSTLSKRTFYNHCQAVSRHFGIDIECRRGRGLNLYRIANPEAIEENTLTKWALDSFSLGQLVLGNSAIADKILLEDVPSGREWLETVLLALQQNRKLKISYNNAFDHNFETIISPLSVKLFKRRWYVLAHNSKQQKRIYSLDRVTDMLLMDETFTYPKDFVPAEYFRDVFGIIAGVDGKAEDIIIRTYAELPNYLRSLPMHHSQREITSNEEYTDFSLHLVPTFDFIQELLLHRDQLEVIRPQSLRQELTRIIHTMLNHYEQKI